jgi:hypothetical protein
MEDFGTDSRMQTRECSGLHNLYAPRSKTRKAL